MREQLISFNTAKLAKEKGFDLEVINYYKEAFPDNLMRHKVECNFNKYTELCVSAPTQSLLQKWLREEHDIIVLVKYPASIDEFTFHIIGKDYHREYFSSYEKALEKGLQEALKLIYVKSNDKWVTEYCHDHTPYRGVCVTCGRY